VRETLNNLTLNEAEIIKLWSSAIGNGKSSENWSNKSYLSETLRGQNGVSAKIELHPDTLNGRHRLVIQEFSAIEGDENYLDCLQLVAHTLSELNKNGLQFIVQAPEGYSDGKQIKADIEALLTPRKENR